MSELSNMSSWREAVLSACSEFLNDPRATTEIRVRSLLNAYRRLHQAQNAEFIADEHEQVMNYR